nr:YuzB family protein [Halobacillus sp. Marseille-P3879]
MVVEVCDGNLINELDVETILEEEYPDVAVLMNECLSFCGLCAIKPYAMVNGTRVFADTPEEALDKIRLKIEEELAFYAE